MNRDLIKDALLGVAVGDAIGVPAEFRTREQMEQCSITGMIGFGTHHQPPGTWSDDSSLTSLPVKIKNTCRMAGGAGQERIYRGPEQAVGK